MRAAYAARHVRHKFLAVIIKVSSEEKTKFV